MFRFLNDFTFNRASFWLGFIAATLFWWLLTRMRPAFKQLIQTLRERSLEARQGLTATVEARFKADMLRYTQSLHVAAPLFALDEILVEAHLLAPPPAAWVENSQANAHIASQTIPYTPDWPELGSAFGAPDFSLAQVFGGETHIAIIAEPGFGKTTALAAFIAGIARDEHDNAALNAMLPIYIHAGEMLAASESIQEPKELLTHLAGLHVSGRTRARLKNLLEVATEGKRLLLIVDDLDEPSPEVFDRALDLLNGILEVHPASRAIVAAAPTFTGKLVLSGFSLLPLASWTHSEKVRFLDRWGKMWEKHVAFLSDENVDLEPALLNAWLLNDSSAVTTPLEMTLLAWGAYAGDSRGRSISAGMEAGIRRLAALGNAGSVEQIYEVASEMAAEMLLGGVAWINPKDIRVTLFDAEPAPVIEHAAFESGDDESVGAVASSGRQVRMGQHLETMQNGGLIRTLQSGQVAFCHPVFLSYLASHSKQAGSLFAPDRSSRGTPVWSLESLARRFVLQSGSLPASTLEQLAASAQEPLYAEFLSLARAIGGGTDDATWKSPFMRRLAEMVQNESHPVALRARAVTGLVLSGSPGIDSLLQRLCLSRHPRQKQLGALGYGLAGLQSGTEFLINMLADSSPNVYRAACVALVAIGNDASLRALADLLLHADENRRRAAAEALAFHPEEGHPTLKDGAEMEDLLVRRATVYGLQRIGHSWAVEILENMRLNDAQWVVKNAASQALDELNAPDPRLPHQLPPMKDTPWLIAFAAEQGEGISGKKAAHEMLLKALKGGNEEQKLAALDTIRLRGLDTGVQSIYDLLYGESGEVCEAAFHTLWTMAGWGVQLPQPAQFGLGIAYQGD